MSLQSLIREGDYATAQEAFAAITTPSVVVEDSQFYTWAGIGEVAGEQSTQPILNALKAANQEAFVYQLGGKGLQLHLPQVQAMLLQFAKLGVPGCAALAAQGVSQKAPWQVDGIATEPTLEEVTNAFNAELRYRSYQSIVNRATAAMEAAAEAYRSPTPTAEEITTAGEEAFEVN